MMKGKGQGKLVQSLLNFQANSTQVRHEDVSSSAFTINAGAQTIARPAPDLPLELWDLIFSGLGTFSIKNFRLVHPKWASTGARFLFQTVYLNVHPQSVDGVIQIASSIHAPLIQNIVWSPLALWPDCSDAERWRLIYKNLLENLKHAELVQLHRHYRRLIIEQSRGYSDDQVTNLATAMGKFVNCREFTVHDDLKDMEFACGDPVLKHAVQRSSQFHRASFWVSRPRSRFLPDEFLNNSTLQDFVNDSIVTSCVKIISSLYNCPSVTQFTVLCKEWFWASVTSALLNSSSTYHRGSGEFRKNGQVFICVRNLYMMLERPINNFRQVCFSNSEVPLEYLGSFSLPELVHLTLRIVPVKYSIVDGMSFNFSEDLVSDEGNEYHESSYHDTTLQIEPTWKFSHLLEDLDGSVSEAASESGGYPPPVDKFDLVKYYQRFVEETKLSQGLVKFPKLEKITLGNVLIDTDLLLAWCWIQPRLPQSRLTITMVDVVLLDQILLKDFVDALSRLNVELVYDNGTTGYFDRSQWAHRVSVESRRLAVASKRFYNVVGWEIYVTEERELKIMPPMAELPKPKIGESVSCNRTDILSSKSPRLHYLCALPCAIATDEEYILDFWEEV